MQILDPGSPMAMATDLRAAFETWTGHGPHAVVRAPGRANLIGDHVDYAGGPVLPLALPHATYAAAGRRDDGVLRLRSAAGGLDDVEVRLADLAPGAPDVADGWAAYAAGMVWALAEDGLGTRGLDVCLSSTVPIGAGLSSSAALLCAVGTAVTEVLGHPLDDALRHRVVAAGIRAEAEMAGAPTGGMDQTVAMFARRGHLLEIDFAVHVGDGRLSHVPATWDAAGLALLVVDTRASHALADGGYAARRADVEAAAVAVGVDTLALAAPEDLGRIADDRVLRRARHVVTETARVHDAVGAVGSGDWAALGRLLDASHASLRDDHEVSCAELDVTVEVAREAGALGARMTGGGFGGSAVALVGREHLPAVAQGLATAYEERGWPAPHLLLGEPAAGASHC